MSKLYYVYILASGRNGTLYTGVTSALDNRSGQHKSKTASSFTKRYNITCLVYYEVHPRIEDAIAREKAIKKWRRAWKIELIEKANPEWNDLPIDAVV